jgi:hypothetical protein
MFQIPDKVPIEHYNPINIHGTLNLVLFILFAVILFITGITFLFNVRDQKIENLKRINLGLGMFSIMYGLTRVIFILMFQDFTNPEENYDFLASVAYSLGIFGFTFMIWSLERETFKTRLFSLISFLLSIITVICTIIVYYGITVVREIALIIIMVGSPFVAIMLLLIHVSLISKLMGTIKRKFIYSFSGMFIMFIGIVLDGQYALSFEPIPIWFKMDVVPILAIFGFLLFIYSALKTIRLLSEFYDSKNICLVHKGNIEKKIFICPNCLVKYCKNCFDSVISKENKCWACEYIFSGKEEVIDINLADVSKSYDLIQLEHKKGLKKG